MTDTDLRTKAALAVAQSAYEIKRATHSTIRDVEFALGEAIGGHLNARRALTMVFMEGFLDGVEAGETLVERAEQLIGERDAEQDPGPGPDPSDPAGA